MKIDIPSPPRTIMEVYQMLPQGTLAELINGQIFMSPAPNNQHQRILKSIFKVLDDFVNKNQLGEIFIAPSDIYLDETSNAVQPDLYFISGKNEMKILESEPNCGVPDLIIEILSPGNNKHDLITKRDLYENFGVKEYWIVDPSTKETQVYHLENKSYQFAGKEIGKVYSPSLNQTFEF